MQPSLWDSRSGARANSGPMVEPSWWADPNAAQERRALTEAFRVGDLEAATADLRGRCERLERSRSSGEVVTVGEVADVLLGQWSVAFDARLADSQRAFFAVADRDRLERAAEDGRSAAVAVRDQYLAPERISGHSLQQALNLANADASRLRPDRTVAISHDDQPLRLSEAAENASQAYDTSKEPQRVSVQDDDISDASRGLLPADRVTDLIKPLPETGSAAVRARIAEEHARRAADGQLLFPNRTSGRGISM
ncbi:MAG: hypothetical protein ACRDZO_20285 [Egibacteraceae bacterium]